MKKNYSIELYLDTQRIKATEKYPVKLKAYLNANGKRMRRYYPTSYDLDEDEYALIFSNQKGVRLSQKQKEIKRELTNLLAHANQIADNLFFFTFEFFERDLLNGQLTLEKTLSWAYEQYIAQLVSLRKVRTADGYRLSLKSLTEFNGNKAPDFLTISPAWLKRYELFMKDRNKSDSTIGIYLRNLKTIFNYAIQEKIIPFEIYPFGKKGYHIPKGQATKKALKKDEITQLMQGKPADKYQQKAKDFWFFSFFGNGMNIKDIALLQFRNIGKETISFVRAKTSDTSGSSKPITFFINPHIRYVLDKYAQQKVFVSDYVFPILEKTDDPETQIRKIKSFNRFISQHMARYAKNLNLDIDINTKIARHSFATTVILSGKSKEYAQEALGHTSSKTTENYFAGFEDETKKAFAAEMFAMFSQDETTQ